MGNDPRPPAEIVLGVTFVALLAWVALAVLIGLPSAAVIIGVIVVTAVSGWFQTIPTTLLTAGMAWLIADGFGQDRAGVLSWDGVPDAMLLLGLVLAGAVVSEARYELARLRRGSSDDREPAAPEWSP